MRKSILIVSLVCLTVFSSGCKNTNNEVFTSSSVEVVDNQSVALTTHTEKINLNEDSATELLHGAVAVVHGEVVGGNGKKG